MYDTALRCKGMQVLLQGLGNVETERFINLLIRDNINYTEWRKTELPEPDSIEDLNRQASDYFRHKHPNV